MKVGVKKLSDGTRERGPKPDLSQQQTSVSAAGICPVPTGDICPVSSESIFPVSTEDETAAGRRPAAVVSSVETG